MLFTRKSFLDRIDARAKEASGLPLDGTKISELILRTTGELYQAAKIEREFEETGRFEVAYHSPITGELEFLVARILFHFSKLRNKNWNVLLRRQVAKTTPDIRIEVNGTAIAVIEIKAKAGFMQPFFSKERFEKDQARLEANLSDFDPVEFVANSKKQLDKYRKAFGLNPEDIFLLLPTSFGP